MSTFAIKWLLIAIVGAGVLGYGAWWLHDYNDAQAAQAGRETLCKAVQLKDCSDETLMQSFDWRALSRARTLNPGIPFYATTLPQTWFGDSSPPPEHGPPPDLAAWRAAHAAGAPWEAGFYARDHGSLQGAIKALGAAGWFPFWPDITAETAAETHARGLKLAAWTPPVEVAQALVRRGCNALCSDDPVALRNIIS